MNSHKSFTTNRSISEVDGVISSAYPAKENNLELSGVVKDSPPDRGGYIFLGSSIGDDVDEADCEEGVAG